jgi:hypothetical protein
LDDGLHFQLGSVRKAIVRAQLFKPDPLFARVVSR